MSSFYGLIYLLVKEMTSLNIWVSSVKRKQHTILGVARLGGKIRGKFIAFFVLLCNFYNVCALISYLENIRK